MDRNNQIWSGKRIVSLCLILCLTFSSCLTYVSSSSAYAAEAVESDTFSAADVAGDTEQTADAGTDDAGQNIEAGAAGSDSTASNGSATDGSTDGKDTGAEVDADSAGGSDGASGSGNDSSAVTNNTVAAAGAEESVLPANVLRADNELQRGEQLKAQLKLQLQLGLRAGALRSALLTKVGEADEIEVSTPVAAELKREADFPEGTKASLYVYEKDELEEVQASLNQYLTQFDVEVEAEDANASAGSADSESVGAEIDGSSAGEAQEEDSGSTTESLELSLNQLEAAEDTQGAKREDQNEMESVSAGEDSKHTSTDSDEEAGKNTTDGEDRKAQTRQVLHTKVQNVYLPLDLSIVDAQGDKLSETGSMTVRLTLGDADLLSQLKQAKEEGVLRLYHRKRAQADNEDAKNAETGSEANLAEGTGNHDWEELAFTIQEPTEEAEGYIEFAAESLSPFLFVKTEQVVTEVTADQAEGADTEDASGTEKTDDATDANASETENDSNGATKEATQNQDQKIYPYFASGLWGVRNSYEPIWEESDCLDFGGTDFVNGKDGISVRFHTYLKGNPYAPEGADGEADDTESSDETTASASSNSQSVAAQSTDSTNLPQTLGVSEEEASDTKTTSLNSDLKETIAYTLTDDTFYLEDKKLEDADYDIKGMEWIFGTTSSKATTGAESDAQAVALTQSSAQAVALTDTQSSSQIESVGLYTDNEADSNGSNGNLELWVGSNDRQTVTIWVRVGAKTNTNAKASATTDTDADDNNTENTESSASDNTTENIQTALDEAIGGNETDTVEIDADTQATTWKVAAIYELTTETYLSIDEDLLTNVDGKKVSFADGVKGVRLTTKNKDAETYLGMYVDTSLYPTANVLNEIETAAEISLTNQTEANASKNDNSLFQKINKTTVWLQDEEVHLLRQVETAEKTVLSAQLLTQSAVSGYTVIFDAGDKTFRDGENTNTLIYNSKGEWLYGLYQEPAGTTATFDGWYDSDTGIRYEINVNGDISPAPMGDMTLSAEYAEGNMKYAVTIYGIGVDEMASGISGLTFGPALGGNYILPSEDWGYDDHVEHIPEGKTAEGNLHRCIHNDSWSTIIAWNEKDPYVYEQCIGSVAEGTTGCTHSVIISENSTTSILNIKNFNVTVEGDGPSALYQELFTVDDITNWEECENNKWNLTDTTAGGWADSNVRAMLNGIEKAENNYSTTNCLLATFPLELQNAIGKRTVRSDIVPNNTSEENVSVTYDKLWLLSTNERTEDCSGWIIDGVDYSHPLEGTVYQKFKGTSRSKSDLKIAWRANMAVGTGGIGRNTEITFRSIYDEQMVQTSISLNGKDSRVKKASHTYAVAPCFTLARTVDNGYTVTFDAREKVFTTGDNTHTVVYSRNGKVIQGDYQEPQDTTVSFDGWYTAETGGKKYTVDVDGNLSPAPTRDITLYAHYKESNMKYAVTIYGIGADTMVSGEAGLTFGPASGADYAQTYVSHTPTGDTVSGNAHRCIHNDSWSTIIAWNEKDPYVYEQCIGSVANGIAGCTHSVVLSENETTDILNTEDFQVTEDGDGPSGLYREIWVDEEKYNHKFNLTDTTEGGWKESNVRAMLNGVTVSNETAYDYTEANCLLATFPEELQNAIGEKVIKADSTEGAFTEENLGVTYDKLWLFSTNELIDDCSDLMVNGVNYSHPLEGTVYEKFQGTDVSVNSLRNLYRVSDNIEDEAVSNITEGCLRSIVVGKWIMTYYKNRNWTKCYSTKEASANLSIAPGFTLVRNVEIPEKTFDVTFDAGTESFLGGKTTNTLTYNALGTRVKGWYCVPLGATDTFAGWYDAQSGGNKYTVDFDGNISPAPTEDMVLYARYTDSNMKYVVTVYGIGVDTLVSGDAGLTFGPALGADYTQTYVEHTPTGVTASGNAHRCIHNDSWNTIIAWNEKDPYVYEQCIGNVANQFAGCTHSVILSEGTTETILNFADFQVTESGDGSCSLYRELWRDSERKNCMWNLSDDTSSGWGGSNIRAMLNGVPVENETAYEYNTTNCLLATFPEELQEAIGERVVKYDTEYDSESGTYVENKLKVCFDKLWLFSTNELAEDCGKLISESENRSHSLEGTVYQKFLGTTADSSEVRDVYQVSDNAVGVATCNQTTGALRSIYAEEEVQTIKGDTGDFAQRKASGSYAISPGFTLARNIKSSKTEYTITFDAGDQSFIGGVTTNVVTYNGTGEKLYGFYQEPVNMAATFEGWYDAQSGGTKYAVDLDGNISPAPTEDMVLYAHYNQGNLKYAVTIYGIGVDEMASGESGLTFGPAFGADYLQSYASHIPTGMTESGNAHRCIHNDSWTTIIAWNKKDPNVYEQCIGSAADGVTGCTHSVILSKNDTETIFNEKYLNITIDGDGPSGLLRELQTGEQIENCKYNLSDTTEGGWQDSNLRAMLNGIKKADNNYSEENCLLAAFPEELQEAIGKRVVKYDSVAGVFEESNLKKTSDKLWLFSVNEVAEDCSGLVENGVDYSHSLEGTVYPKFKGTTADSEPLRIANRVADNVSESVTSFWGTSLAFRSIYNGERVLITRGIDAKIINTTASAYLAVAPGFTLAKDSVQLTVSNAVQGNMGSKVQEFSYKVKLTSAQGMAIKTGLAYVKTNSAGAEIETGVLAVSAGVYTFSLSHGESICIKEIPMGCEYAVTETTGVSAGYVVTCDSPNGTLLTNLTVAFTNTKNSAIPTLAVTGIGVLLGLGLAAVIILLLVRRRRSVQ